MGADDLDLRFIPFPVRGRDGELFASHKEAGAYYGVPPQTIGYHLDRYGNLDRVGAKPGVVGCQNAAKSLHLFGHVWPSRLQAARDLCLSKTKLYALLRAIRQGGDEGSDAWAELRQAIWHYEHPNTHVSKARKAEFNRKSRAGKRSAKTRRKNQRAKETKHERIYRGTRDHRQGNDPAGA